ncbi:MAG: hypothetical protein JO301_00585, partial [Chitinophagaceae bacterium]|nr:hypothetical protein [Chitinophagaceae bacterium]
MKKAVVTIALVVVLAGCGTLDVFEKTKFFPQHEWKSSDKPAFNFNIEDTSSLYNIFVVFRHEDAYHFNNLWLNITTHAPHDSARSQQVNITLADNKRG